ncbi:uncharacterized protein [Argopecten irradians]|uniref:uncharacterized protein isoform X2 n=1 Tax=Argopecten irradians TaxID=31199 RepID=UPI00371A0E62
MEQDRSERAGSPDSFCSDKGTYNVSPHCDLQKQRNRAIVRQLLDEFDMEETVARYRNQESQDFVLDEGDFSVDSSLSALRIRQKLLRLMGTDVIRLNDKSYTDTLLDKLKQEYESNVEKKEKALQEAEKKRLRKLMLEGVISAQVMKNPDGKQRRSKRIKQNRKNNSHTNIKAGPPSIMHEDSPYYQHERPASPTQPMDLEQNVVSQMEHIENEESEENENIEKMSQDHKSDDSSKGGQKEKKQVQWSQPKRQMNCGDAPVTGPKRVYPTGKYAVKESALLRDFRDEETVAGLYRLAEKLVL